MKAEAEHWLTIAKSDYDSALYLFAGARYPQALYFMCQAVEKILKACQVEFANVEPKKTHLLADLAQASGLAFSSEQTAFLEDLAKGYGRVRYSDYGQTLYNTKTKVEPIIKRAQEIYLWILTKLEHH